MEYALFALPILNGKSVEARRATPRRVKQKSRRSADRRNRGLRDHHAMEQRRMRAADLFEQGMIPIEIARRVGVAHQVVSEWRKA